MNSLLMVNLNQLITYRFKNWISGFFYFWFLGALKKAVKVIFLLSLGFEDIWATIITFKTIFTPIFQDYSFTGRIVGPFFRLFRVIIGIIVHLVIFVIESLIFIVFLMVFYGPIIFLVINIFT